MLGLADPDTVVALRLQARSIGADLVEAAPKARVDFHGRLSVG